MQKVLVAGATGYLGRFVVHEFKRRGYWVRVLARNPKKIEQKGSAPKEIEATGSAIKEIEQTGSGTK